jgi:tetratricopeptide (TPR) repeat protein
VTGVDQQLADALARHRAGALDEAAEHYGRILVAQPGHPDALHLLGVVEQQRGRLDSSVELIRRALTFRSDPVFASNLANAFLSLGRYAEAEQACRQALAANPAIGMAHGNLGIALHAQGRLDEAAEALRQAIALDPARPEPQASLGVVLLDLGRREDSIAVLTALLAAHPDAAIAHYNLANVVAADQTPANLANALAHYDRAIALVPGYADAQANRAAILRRMELYEASEAGFHAALALNPNSALTHYNHGLLLGEMDQPAEALAAHDRAIALAPNLAVAHSHRGNMLSALERAVEAMAAHSRALALAPDDALLHHNLGLSFGHEALLEQAIAAQSRSIALKPDYAPAYAALAAALAELDRADDALDAARRAIALDPTLGMAHSSLGQALMAKGDLDAAEIALEEAVARRPNLAQSHLNLGVVHLRQGRVTEAEVAYRRALELRSEIWEANYNLGVVHLQQGRYAEAWPGFEHRLRAPARRRADARYAQPIWRGEELTGKTILLHGEQGLGDILQSARFIAAVAALGARVMIEAQSPARRLLERLPGVERFVETSEPCPPTDFHLPLFSLPERLRVTLDSLPGPIPYLNVDPALTATWRARIDAAFPRPAPRVGIVWSGNVTAKVDRGRSIPLAAFAPLATRIGAPLISLQKLYGLEQLDDLGVGMAVEHLGEAYEAGDLADTAAVIQALDLVIACDTSVAHLAGALGAPVWLAINAVGDWRWLTDRTDSPWYPSLRIYRQPTVGDWDGVFEAMAADWGSRAGR